MPSSNREVPESSGLNKLCVIGAGQKYQDALATIAENGWQEGMQLWQGNHTEALLHSVDHEREKKNTD